MMLQGTQIGRAVIMTVVGLAIAATSTARADYALIGYYNSQTVTQLTIGSGANTAITGASNFGQINGNSTPGGAFSPEAISCLTNIPGANPTEVLVVDLTDGTVRAYSPSGTLISNNILKTGSGAALTLQNCSIAGATLSSDGQSYYLAASSTNGTNASGIYQFNAVTGKEIGFVAFNDVHDVTFHNGYVYATAYQSTTQTGVYQFNADLTGMTRIIAPNGGSSSAAPTASANDLYNATGMTFVGNNLFVGNASINAGSSGQSFVQEYSLIYSTNPTSTTASYVNTFSDPSLIINPFGMTTGPDGNVYISSLGTIGNSNGQITELNVATANGNSGNSPLSTYLANGAYNGLAGNAPKYLMFESQATVFVPEPGSIVLMGLGIAGLAVFGGARKRKIAQV